MDELPHPEPAGERRFHGCPQWPDPTEFFRSPRPRAIPADPLQRAQHRYANEVPTGAGIDQRHFTIDNRPTDPHAHAQDVPAHRPDTPRCAKSGTPPDPRQMTRLCRPVRKIPAASRSLFSADRRRGCAWQPVSSTAQNNPADQRAQRNSDRTTLQKSSEQVSKRKDQYIVPLVTATYQVD